MNPVIHYGYGIYAIDAMYIRPGLAAIYLIVQNGRAAIFDCGTNASIPQVLYALESLGVSTSGVEYVVPSHVHLDHAGGAGAMMEVFPNATLVVHPRGARHMADPSRLVEGARSVYGEATAQTLYGDLKPVPLSRIVEACDGMVLDLAGRILSVLDTPGHAKHHICLRDNRTGHIFAGDAFGVSHRELDVEGRAFVFALTSPVQFDPQAIHASIDNVLSERPGAIYLAHFGQVTDVHRLGSDLHRLVDAHCTVAWKVNADGKEERHSRLVDVLRQLLVEERVRQGWQIGDAKLFDMFSDELDVNAQGLEVWLDSLS
ncbi:MBL fold metallo-hydrolase [Aromatoleum bremense]|uniref:MBL fold metallo-hydrolase n=1 Tax=Aromatoleum bremense TaxID=76115 RepID=A0ABX1NVG7_9RHOO|nr:MBL fold metallo-hydrolase [Aromatoleum bremense]NMG15768.1 MBL fold metallo-hydrolase [Aromatoleum bremense]QTQ30029.1 Metallo-beta-lactamase domain-containing protein [Aromatoleum bremense]